jgi:hypothetical protein
VGIQRFPATSARVVSDDITVCMTLGAGIFVDSRAVDLIASLPTELATKFRPAMGSTRVEILFEASATADEARNDEYLGGVSNKGGKVPLYLAEVAYRGLVDRART